MKQLAEKLVARNYKKRMLAILIAAVVLFAAVAVLIPTTLHKQLAEFRALEEAREEQKSSEVPAERDSEHDGKKQEIKAVLRRLTPVGKGTKLAFAAVALLAFLLGVFYWVTVAEWLYKTAVRNGLNRALWPMLGLLFNILAIPALLIVLCDPKREKKQTA